ncbi:MAG: hypothetical protein ABUS49_03575 [Acidobacteriota bacterium]
MAQTLKPDELAREIRQRRGLIPFALETPHRRICWMDLEEFHCYQGFLEQALASYKALRGSEPQIFLSPFDALPAATEALAESGGALAPSALVFHAGRCGSTLLAKVLARSRSNIVFGEAPAHNQVWKALDGTGADEAISLYRQLLCAMGRRRLASYRAHIIKFTSYNIMRFKMIRAAFPDTPALFLFREPRKLLDSYHREIPPWMGRDLDRGMAWQTPELAAEDFFRAAVAVRDENFRVLEYSALTPRTLPAILQFFNQDVSPSDLRLMSAEFSWNAKSSHPQPFIANTQAPLSSSAPRLRDLYCQLVNRAHVEWRTDYEKI